MAATTTEIFGSMVFNDHVMKERLPSATYKSLHETIRRGAPLDVEVANVVANAMKDWAIERGATTLATSGWRLRPSFMVFFSAL